MGVNMRIKTVLIAPCGIDCALCMGYQREKNKCGGCRAGRLKCTSCQNCVVINCAKLAKLKKKFCIYCADYPCRRLKQLDKRYKSKYNTSVFENLAYIKEHGVKAFAEMDLKRWTCKKCGALMCVHREHKCG